MNVAPLLSYLATYDAAVRSNDSEDFPAVENVAFCSDGYLGAWGELLDVVPGELADEEYDALHDLFVAYQGILRREVAARQAAADLAYERAARAAR